MKPMSAMLAALAWSACPAFADQTYQSTVSGTVTLEVAPTPAAGQSQTTETLTLRFVHPSEPAADESEAREQRDLKTCGAKWNAKLKAHKEELEQTRDYRDYWEKWKDSPGQRPPKLPLPVLTRASYRLWMARCLNDETAVRPRGLPDPTK